MRRCTVVLVLAVLVVAGCRVIDTNAVERPREGAESGPVLEEPWADYAPRAPEAAKLPRAAEQRLTENGFVVLADWPVFNITQYFFATCDPHFITSDAVLYVFATLFRGGLIEHERTTLRPMLDTLVRAGLSTAEADLTHRQGTPLAGAAEANVLLFAVASALLGEAPPAAVAAQAQKIIARIEAADQTEYYPGEDWTMYALRGHYAENADLAGYYRATRWLSRYILPLLPGVEAREESDLRLRQAVLLGKMIRADRTLGNAWRAYMDELSFLIGPPDSINPVTVAEAADRVLPSGHADGSAPALATGSALAALRAEFATSRYAPSAIMPVPQANPGNLPEKYCQLVGERYIVDSEIMQRTCFPHVGGRVLPSGLDVGATVLGFERARTHLEPEFAEHAGLATQIDALGTEFASFSADADRGTAPVFDQWLGALGELSRDATKVAPEFMRTEAWRDKQLNCALASWAMLRHDYLLYGKQGMPPVCMYAALVEPVPDLYRRLEVLAMALDGRGFRGMDGVAELCRNLREMSLVMLGEKRLEDARFDEKYSALYLYHFGHWLLEHFTPHVSIHDPTVVVDVSSTLQGDRAGVFEAATGPLYPIVAIAGPEDTPLRPMPDARYVGVVMSYHEWEVWTEGDAQRMTDEQWRQEIRRGRDRERRPEWTESFMVR